MTTNKRMMAGIRVFVLNSWTVVLSREPQADTSAPALSAIEGWEREIDALAQSGQLYGLSQEEINIVEGKG